MIAKNIMQKNVISVEKHDKVEKVIKMLSEHNISGVPVVDEGLKVIGVVTEADLIVKEKEPHIPSYIDVLGSIIYIEGVKKYEEDLRKMVATEVKDIMTDKVYTINEEDDVEKVAEIMVEASVNRVPVVNHDGVLVGIISRQDMLKLLIP